MAIVTNLLVCICFLLFTLCSFYFGLQYGKMKATAEVKPCPKLILPEATVIWDPPESANPVACKGKKIYDHCTAGPYEDRTHLHIYSGIISNEIFGNLHHPASPAKTAYVINEKVEWIGGDKDAIPENCNEVYLTRTGQRASQPNKCVSIVRVPEGVTSPVHHSHRTGFTARLTDQYLNDHARGISFTEEFELLQPLLAELETLQKQFVEKMGNPIGSDGQRKTAIVMVANEGVMDLLLNFVCSAEGVGIDVKMIMVYVGTKEYVKLIENMGANAIYSPSLGSMPSQAARGYLDTTFQRMMWFKTTSVFLAASSGFEVLFQDADLVWLADPIPYLRNLKEDIAFMDDGARTPRYTPLFVNSGFFFMKYNERVLYFQEKMMKCGVSEIGYSHSHQSVLIRHLAESMHLAGLQVKVLDQLAFPSGQAYHENKKFIEKIKAKTVRPYVFHMCWTENRVDKVVYFKEMGMWYVNDAGKDATATCSSGRSLLSAAIRMQQERGGETVMDACCQRKLYWPKGNATL